MTRTLHGQYTREQVYMMALLKACEIDPPEGGGPYKYTIVNDILYPVRTTVATNKQMMTACRACEYLAAEWEIGPLPEHVDE